MNFSLILRSGSGKIGPVISDQGHIIADLQPASGKYDGIVHNPIHLEKQLSSIIGIAGHGLFCKIAHLVVVGSAEKGPYVLEPV